MCICLIKKGKREKNPSHKKTLNVLRVLKNQCFLYIEISEKLRVPLVRTPVPSSSRITVGAQLIAAGLGEPRLLAEADAAARSLHPCDHTLSHKSYISSALLLPASSSTTFLLTNLQNALVQKYWICLLHPVISRPDFKSVGRRCQATATKLPFLFHVLLGLIILNEFGHRSACFSLSIQSN